MSVVEAGCSQITKAASFHLLIHDELMFKVFEMHLMFKALLNISLKKLTFWFRRRN